jgi:ABC-2 type transport system ATP-binding protein
VRTDDSERVAKALTELAQSEIAVADFAFGRPSLDEVFLALTGRPAQEDTDTQEDAA